MGDFLSTPNTLKESSDGQNDLLKYGSSAMQGWRYRMEDAHLHQLNNKNYDIFGVFDGHGGKEVSLFVKNHFIEEFMNNKNTKYENISKALIETFLKMDELLRTKKGREELNLLNKQSKKEFMPKYQHYILETMIDNVEKQGIEVVRFEDVTDVEYGNHIFKVTVTYKDKTEVIEKSLLCV